MSDVRVFTEEYLRRDGIFVLQMIEMNVGGLVVETLVGKLWDQFVEEKDEALRDRDGETDSVDGKAFLDVNKKPSFVRSRVHAGRDKNVNSTMA